MTVTIRGGTVVDGTGSEPVRADVVVVGDRVIAVGPDAGDAGADTVIDATGQLVAPGFVDLHTHYDAQLFWDPNASPSPLHGVTTVLGGNCGFSLAPLAPEHVDYISRMMARVEGMPLAALQAGLPWDWRSFGEWSGHLDGRIAVNAGFLVGHSTLRRLGHGGALGRGQGHGRATSTHGGCAPRRARGGCPGLLHLPGAHAQRRRRPARALAGRRPRGDGAPGLGGAGPRGHHRRADRAGLPERLHRGRDRLPRPDVIAGRPARELERAGRLGHESRRSSSQLAAGTAAAERGATVLALTLPHTMQLRLSFEHGAILDGLPGWREVFALPVEERMVALSDPETRRRLDAGAQSDEAGILRHLAVWDRLIIDETFAADNAAWEGHSVGEVAAARNLEPFDALLDIVVADRLRTGLRPPIGETEEDWVLRARTWQDPRAIVGGSDAGAHLDTMCGAIYSTSMLGDGVRARGCSAGSRRSVSSPTSRPASTACATGAGSCRARSPTSSSSTPPPSGMGRCAPAMICQAAPAGSTPKRSVSNHVLVNGTEIVRRGAFTGAVRAGCCAQAPTPTPCMPARTGRAPRSDA